MSDPRTPPDSGETPDDGEDEAPETPPTEPPPVPIDDPPAPPGSEGPYVVRRAQRAAKDAVASPGPLLNGTQALGW